MPGAFPVFERLPCQIWPGDYFGGGLWLAGRPCGFAAERGQKRRMHLRVKVRVAAIGDPAPEHRHAVSCVDMGTIEGGNETLVGLKTENALHPQFGFRQMQFLVMDRHDCIPQIPHLYCSFRPRRRATIVRDAGVCAIAILSVSQRFRKVCCSHTRPRVRKAGASVVRGKQRRIIVIGDYKEFPVGAEGMSKRKVTARDCQVKGNGAG